jgi:hypothetical protein
MLHIQDTEEGKERAGVSDESYYHGVINQRGAFPLWQKNG